MCLLSLSSESTLFTDHVFRKIVLEARIGKGIVSQGIPIIVEDMQFSGLMKFKIKLQIPFPHVSGLRFRA